MINIPAGPLGKYPVGVIGGQPFVYLRDPPAVWTPSGYRTAPQYLCVDKMPTKQNLIQAIDMAKGRTPRQRLLTSGEWYQISLRLEETNPEIENNMITGPSEATATIADYEHGKKVEKKSGLAYFDGLLMQHPETDGNGYLATDEKGILKARDMWEMPLPLKGGYIDGMPKNFKKFIDTIYGMRSARKKLKLPHAYLFWSENPTGLISLLRGGWIWPTNVPGRVRVHDWRTFGSDEDVASRAAIENVKLDMD